MPPVGDKDLYELIRRVERTVRLRAEVQRSDREDAVQECYAKVKPRLKFVETDDLQGYVYKTIQHFYVDILRGAGRLSHEEPPPESGNPGGGEAERPMSPTERRTREAEVRESMTRLAQRVIAVRAPRYQERARVAWAQIAALAFDGASFRSILQRYEGVGPNSTADEVRKAEQRVYQNHTRFRRSMRAVVKSDVSAGRLTREQGKQLFGQLMWLFRNGARHPSRKR